MTTTTINLFDGIMTINIDGEPRRFRLDVDGDLFSLDNPTKAMSCADDTAALHLGYRRVSDWISVDGDLFSIVADFEPHQARCGICADGCTCEAGSTGCGHHGCWGNDAIRNTCPGVAAMTPPTLANA